MKLVTETKTNVYELTYLVSAGYTDSELKKVQDDIQTAVKKYKGEILSEVVWGKKPLAYSLRKAGKTYDEAYYVHMRVNVASDKAPELERDVYLHTAIIRHLFVVGTEEQKEETVVKE